MSIWFNTGTFKTEFWGRGRASSRRAPLLFLYKCQRPPPASHSAAFSSTMVTPLLAVSRDAWEDFCPAFEALFSLERQRHKLWFFVSISSKVDESQHTKQWCAPHGYFPTCVSLQNLCRLDLLDSWVMDVVVQFHATWTLLVLVSMIF